VDDVHRPCRRRQTAAQRMKFRRECGSIPPHWTVQSTALVDVIPSIRLFLCQGTLALGSFSSYCFSSYYGPSRSFSPPFCLGGNDRTVIHVLQTTTVPEKCDVFCFPVIAAVPSNHPPEHTCVYRRVHSAFFVVPPVPTSCKRPDSAECSRRLRPFDW
jgi:hypothetical protein